MNDRLNLEEALRDHSLEGITVLVAEPSLLIRATNYLIAVLFIAVMIWAFVAKADVIVTAAGTLVPEEDIRRVYVPIDGELVDIYVSVGAPVRAGDIVARINARGAIDAASKAIEAQIRLEDTRREYEAFPAKKVLMQRKSESLQNKLDFLQGEYDKLLADGMLRLAEAQRAKLAEARAEVEQAQRNETTARDEAAQFERLFAMEGGGGVSRSQVERKRNEALDAQARTRSAQARLTTLEYELNNAITQADNSAAKMAQELADTRIQFETSLRDIEREQAEVEVRFRSARLAAESAERLSFRNFDENNFLKIYAPISGVVTQVPYAQEGDKIQANQPLLSIAPADSRMVLQVQIAESDRGFLAVGQPAKLKFNAFPYQNYGSIDGRLDYISPTIINAKESSPAAYEGKIRLQRESVDTVNGPTNLRYGMSAVAEIVVRERRVIDLALDPLRRFN
ncbi:MAG: HlyD family efflux transporter periplasmic adaptor subunit [Pseudomonadales bacterium]|nr:HlyD family efflux transporter periplasmic adaptor subunit [Pseudomonadales bacterium]MCP5183278.1 HlyD family efflux transporter periplasmic adaptor subunit [Pseudomonadales bacterium]